jgi:hypothetical protein
MRLQRKKTDQALVYPDALHSDPFADSLMPFVEEQESKRPLI